MKTLTSGFEIRYCDMIEFSQRIFDLVVVLKELSQLDSDIERILELIDRIGSSAHVHFDSLGQRRMRDALDTFKVRYDQRHQVS